MLVNPSTSGQSPVSRTAKAEGVQAPQVTKEQQTANPPAPVPTRDQFVNLQMEQFKSLSEDRQAQKRAEFERIYDQADKSQDGTVDLGEFNALVAGLTEPKATIDAQAPQPATTEGKIHPVAAGDTMGRIARANGLSIEDLKAANPDLFQNGKDASGRRRTAGGDLIYPGDQIKVPTKEPAKPSGPAQANEPTAKDVQSLQQHFEQISGGDGKISKEDLQQNMPASPTKDALLKYFDALKFGSIEADADAWDNLSKADVDRLAGAMSGGSTMEAVLAELAAENPHAMQALEEIGKQEAAQYLDQTKGEVEKALSAKAGHPVKIEWVDDMSDEDKLRQLDMLQKMATDPSYNATWKKYDQIAFDVYESRRDSGDLNNLAGYVEEEGKTLKINQPGNGWGGGSDLTDVEFDKQIRAMEQLRDKTNHEASATALEAQLEQALTKKAGHPVQIVLPSDMSTEDRLKQLNHLKDLLEDPKLDPVWSYYNQVQFNTFRDRHDSGDATNLTDYVQVDNRTLKINNAGDDGITAAEMDKQRRALEHLRDTGKPYAR